MPERIARRESSEHGVGRHVWVSPGLDRAGSLGKPWQLGFLGLRLGEEKATQRTTVLQGFLSGMKLSTDQYTEVRMGRTA